MFVERFRWFEWGCRLGIGFHEQMEDGGVPVAVPGESLTSGTFDEVVSSRWFVDGESSFAGNDDLIQKLFDWFR